MTNPGVAPLLMEIFRRALPGLIIQVRRTVTSLDPNPITVWPSAKFVLNPSTSIMVSVPALTAAGVIDRDGLFGDE